MCMSTHGTTGSKGNPATQVITMQDAPEVPHGPAPAAPAGRRRRSVHGDHAATQPMPIGVQRIKPVSYTQRMPAVDITPDPRLSSSIGSGQPSSWSARHYEAFRWFGLVLNYLGYAFVIAVIGLVMTEGLILIWQGWLSDLGK